MFKTDNRRKFIGRRFNDGEIPSGSSSYARTRLDSYRSRLGSRSGSLALNLNRKLSHFSSTSAARQLTWIEQKFHKRECFQFIPTSNVNRDKCGCGRHRHDHPISNNVNNQNLRWSIRCHTKTSPTDAFGTIEFRGGPHPHKAQYVRLSFDSDPADILHLFEDVWDLPRPKLVITVHGGIANFNLQPKLARVFKSGLLKAAKTTGAWIITSGINTGVVRYVASALCDTGVVNSLQDIVSIGVAPWGLLKKREIFLGRDIAVQYHPKAFSTRSRFAILNDKHSFFLLVDNGTVGRYGADIILRSRFEQYISRQCIETFGKCIPVVCVVLEGGTCTIRSILDYVTNSIPVPVVVCDGSGRAADLLAFAHGAVRNDGLIPEAAQETLISTIQNCFQYSMEQAEKLYSEILMCVKKKDLITIFRLGEEDQYDVDHAILTALLKGQRLSATDQLSLALTWNRPDIARSDIFTYGRDWPSGVLEAAMMEALQNDSVEFVKLLLENGVQMDKFLTFQRLEDLYNSEKGPTNTLGFIVRDVVRIDSQYKYVLNHIGLVLEKLMGGAFQSTYRSKEFLRRYSVNKTKPKLKMNVPDESFVKIRSDTSDTLLLERDVTCSSSIFEEPNFKYPFNDLFLWAVLTKRQEMALCMWQHGEDALTKALIASRLYKHLAREAAEDYLEVEICEEFKNYAREFRKLALDLLEQCYQTDGDFTLQLLTYELEHWGMQTNISLAVVANHKDFLAHPCCQVLLSDLWHGGLRVRKYINAKILACVFFPPLILTLTFKTKEQLRLQPQTAQEFTENNNQEIDYGSTWMKDWMEGGCEDRHEDELHEKHFPPRKIGRFSRETSNDPDERDPFVNMILQKDSKDTSYKSQTTSDFQRDLKSMKSANKSKLSTVTLSGMYRESIYQMASNFHFVQRPLPWTKKFYEFYVAPLTTFWSWTVAYGIFLFLFTYSVLTKYYLWPKWQEWYTIAYVLTLAIENVRRLIISEGRTFALKLVVFFNYRWNLCYSVAIWCFFIAMVLRFYESTLQYARVVYACDIVFWYILILEVMSVHHKLGVYVSMMGKMISSMFYLISILFVVLCSFGVMRQSIHFPHNDWDWQMARNIVYKPYFMLYGEVYAGEIDTCGDEGEGCDVQGYWLTPAYMAVFMMIANILIINVMIAVFNFIFLDVNAKAQQVWKFSRYRVVLDYEYKPFLAPPFIIFYHIYFIIKYCFRRKKHEQNWFDYALKLFLSPEGVKLVHDFEEQCMEDYYHIKLEEKASSPDERIKRTNDRVEFLSMKLDDIADKLKFTKNTLQKFERKQMDILTMIQEFYSNKTSPLPSPILPSRDKTDNIIPVNFQRAIKFDSIIEDDEMDESKTISSPTSRKQSLDESRKKLFSPDKIVVNREYSTIMDESNPTEANVQMNSPSFASFIGGSSPPTTLTKNANSFALRENELLREYEEDGSLIAGSLLGHRIRTTSISLGVAGALDLLEMGYDEEPEVFLHNLEATEESLSSSDSLNSPNLERHGSREDNSKYKPEDRQFVVSPTGFYHRQENKDFQKNSVTAKIQGTSSDSE